MDDLGRFGIHWNDLAAIEKVIREKIPDMLASDSAYQSARRHADAKNTRLEGELAIKRAILSILADHIELFQQFTQNPQFKEWLTSVVLRPADSAHSS